MICDGFVVFSKFSSIVGIPCYGMSWTRLLLRVCSLQVGRHWRKSILIESRGKHGK